MNIPEIFGENVFNQEVMREKLPPKVYDSLKKTIDMNTPLEPDVAKVVANAMKDWAIEKGATHYTHWFQPMTGITAEKHDSFISPTANGNVLMEFSGKELIKGEPDASSFPSGGLRATFEARGYTAWDPTSPAFIKDNTLCIPTAFCSFTGDALDKKTPLLRSAVALNKQAMRILKLFKNTQASRVFATAGAEQEYFLIDKSLFDKRKDLIFTGRTLFGAKPPKGQELDDHYFGTIKPRVKAFMKELNCELWKLGVLAKTEHNETAPAQHELAPVFTTVNLATDHNQITMEMMKKVAARHNLVCLLHEKPFAGVNGSGKHNNWSLCTDTGVNLLEPGSSPSENAQFLLFLCSVIKAVDKHQDLLRLSAASAGNDHRLGANEAPPAIISMFIGADLEEVIDAIEKGSKCRAKEKCSMKLGVDSLPELPMDSTDRNRTSPFAFTGNKFEFRMVGSAFSISGPNIVLNTIVADALCGFADELEKAEDFNKALNDIALKTVRKHRKIIFNGNNYSEEWREEAARRGLLNLPSTAEALPLFTLDKNVKVFEKHCVFSKREVESRTEIMLENYCKTINIEALTMIDMVRKEIYPAVNKYIKELASVIKGKSDLKLSEAADREVAAKLSELNRLAYEKAAEIESLLAQGKDYTKNCELAMFYRKNIFENMQLLRSYADEAEGYTAKDFWPFPTYGELLFNI